MKKILLSLALIGLTAGAVGGATWAYFSDTKVLGNNTFSAGTVELGAITPGNITLTDLKPGETRQLEFSLGYSGSINAKIFLGAGGSSPTTSPNYLADHLQVQIYEGADLKFDHTAQYLSTYWFKLIDDAAPGSTKNYVVKFTLDAETPNEHQAANNTDTVLLFQALQLEATDPTSMPFQDYLDGKITN